MSFSGIAVATARLRVAGDRHLALPDEAARAVGDVVDIVGAKRHRQLVGVDARHQVALVDLEDAQLDPVEVDRRHRQPGAALARQHIAGVPAKLIDGLRSGTTTLVLKSTASFRRSPTGIRPAA
jgi:hypothetical protein